MTEHRLEIRDKGKPEETRGSLRLTDREVELIIDNPELLDMLCRFGQVASGGADVEVAVEEGRASAMERLPSHEVDGQTFVSIPIPPLSAIENYLPPNHTTDGAFLV